METTNDQMTAIPVRTRCASSKKDGEPCTNRTYGDGVYCLWHDPNLQEERRAISIKGGYARGNKARVLASLPDALTADELERYLGLVLRGVVEGKVTPGVGKAAAGVARVIVAIQQVRKHDERLNNLEDACGMLDHESVDGFEQDEIA